MSEPGALVLLVDDEKQIHRFLRPALEAAGFRVRSAMSGNEALRLLRNEPPDLVLLDLGLPDLDGTRILQALSGAAGPPVIVLSARDQEREKIAVLDAGATDFVEKPFGLGELLARLRSALRRGSRSAGASPAGPATEPLRRGSILLDAVLHEVRVEGVPVALSPRERRLLALLMQHPNRVLTHAQILARLWGPAHAEDVQYLRVYVGQLRRKLGAAGASMIKTEAGIGYMLAVPGHDEAKA